MDYLSPIPLVKWHLQLCRAHLYKGLPEVNESVGLSGKTLAVYQLRDAVDLILYYS